MQYILFVTNAAINRIQGKYRGLRITGDVKRGTAIYSSNGESQKLNWTAPLAFDDEDCSNAEGNPELSLRLLEALTNPNDLENVSDCCTLIPDYDNLLGVQGLLGWLGGRLVVVAAQTENVDMRSHSLAYAVATGQDPVDPEPPSLIVVPPQRRVLLYAALTGHYWPGKDS